MTGSEVGRLPGAADLAPVAALDADENSDRDPENSSEPEHVYETTPSQSAARAYRYL